MEFISEKKKSLSTVLENIFLISLKKDQLVLGITEDDRLALQIVEDKNNQGMIVNALVTVAGFKPFVEITQVNVDVKAFSIAAERKKIERDKKNL